MSKYNKEWRREYYLKHRDRLLEYARVQRQGYIPLYRRDMKSYIRYLCGKAKLRKRKEFDLTYDYLYDVWDKQNGLCAFSGVPLNNEANHNEAGSLDRIDSSIGYIEGNVQFVCAIVNRMKQELPDQDFLRFCELITNNRNKDDLLT